MTTPTAGESGSGKTPVLLFKSPSDKLDQTDPYETTLTNGGYRPTWVPVLTERWILNRLIEIIRDAPRGWKGVVMSSKRAAQAWISAVEEVLPHESEIPHREDGSAWADVSLYTVGSSISEALDGAKLGGWRPGRRKTISAKSASALLPLIDSSDTASETRAGYLFLRGDKSLDVLSNGLRERGEDVEEVIVYETTPRDDISTSIHTALRDFGGTEEMWLAFFAPSSASMSLPHLSRHGLLLPSNTSNGREEKPRAKVFAIGETTAAFLSDQRVRVDAVAEEPTVEGMIAAMEAIDSLHRHSIPS